MKKLCFRFLIGLILALFIGFITINCGGDGDDSTPPKSSKWDSMVWDRDEWG